MNNEILQKLKIVFPDAVTEKQVIDDNTGKISFEYALKEEFIDTLKDNFNLANDNQAYGLNFPGKKLAKLVASEPSYKTLKLKSGDGVNEDTTQNVYIEGDNLEVLKVLKNAYQGQIKMIYIDPPYNTGSDGFVYNDDFSETQLEYWKKLGYINEDGAKLVKENSENLKGYKHSGWLTFMYPRLKLARDLLRDDGVIFISIDDNEVHNLRLICDEIFGADNLLAQFIWRTDGNFDNQAKVKNCHEYILSYTKNINLFPAPPVIDFGISKTSKLFKTEIRNTIVKNGSANPISQIVLKKGFPAETQTGVIEARVNKWPKYMNDAFIEEFYTTNDVIVESGWSSKDLLIQFINNSYQPIIDNKGQLTSFVISRTGAIEVIKHRQLNQSHVISVITNAGNTQTTSAGLAKDGIYFSYPKPPLLIEYLLKMNLDNSFIVLDFFSGSATTAHAVMKLNTEDGGKRKYICVQIPEATKPDSEAAKAGYPNICEIGKERIRRAGKQILTEWQNKQSTTKDDLLNVDAPSQISAQPDVGFKVFTLTDSPLYQDNGNIDDDNFTQDKLDNLNVDYAFNDILYHYILRVGVILDKVVTSYQRDNFNYAITERKLLLLDNNLTQVIAEQIISQHRQEIDKLYYTVNSLDAFTSYTEIEGIAKRHNLPCEVL